MSYTTVFGKATCLLPADSFKSSEDIAKAVAGKLMELDRVPEAFKAYGEPDLGDVADEVSSYIQSGLENDDGYECILTYDSEGNFGGSNSEAFDAIVDVVATLQRTWAMTVMWSSDDSRTGTDVSVYFLDRQAAMIEHELILNAALSRVEEEVS